ncbi:hypothetical protein, partial [Klebsiella pneumoniae]|uniref:hypothetical protein n=1 Tax=Klebsiella pneumoniae TaxID=573 RepID=UPI0030EEFFAB
PVTAEPVDPASAAPPGGEQQSGCLSLCRMAASPYPAYGPAGERGTRRPGKRSAAGRSTLERVLSLCRMAASPYPANGS